MGAWEGTRESLGAGAGRGWGNGGLQPAPRTLPAASFFARAEEPLPVLA